MTPSIKPAQKALIIALATLGLLPATGFSKSKPITTTDLLRDLSPTEPWRKGQLTATKTVLFQKTSGDAAVISKITLAYFTSANCTGAKAGDGFYTTPNDSSTFAISTNALFGITAAATWNVGVAQLNIPANDMVNINSVAITLKSSNNDVPQSNFSGRSFACVPVLCADNACTSGSGTQDFGLKATAVAVGDPADGGKIADLAGLIAASSDNSAGIRWTNSNAVTGAQSNTDGSANTAAIVGNASCSGSPGNCAAQLCNNLSIAGGYTTGWFLPAKNQLATLYTNRTAIGGFADVFYWSSTESTGSPAVGAWSQGFGNGGQFETGKTNPLRVRCVRAFIP